MTASLESNIRRIARLVYSVSFGIFWYYSPANYFRKIRFMSDEEVVDSFLNGKSITRFGDGELRVMEKIPSDFFQENDNKLSDKLIDVVGRIDDNLIVCLPRPLKTFNGLNMSAKLFWISNIYWNRRAWKKYINLDRTYGNTQITRPYIDCKNKEVVERKFENLKRIWNNKNICIIEGRNTHFGEGNDLLENTKKIKRILASPKNAFREFDEILIKAKKVNSDFIFLVALGPTATVLVSELAQLGRVAFDVGHLDIEYEWFRRGAKKKSAVDNKSVNESR